MYVPYTRSRKRKKRSVVARVALIVLLAISALILTYLALTRVGDSDHDGLPSAPAAPLPEPAPTAVEPPAEPPAEPPVEAVTRRLLVSAGDIAMRAEGGTCDTPGSVEISLDGGREWVMPGTPTEAGGTEILRLLPLRADQLEVVALDENCEPQIFRTVDQGVTWTGPLTVEGTWYFNPSTPWEVGAPEGTRPLPCEAAQLSADGNRAALACRDGSLALSGDRGLSWDTYDIHDVLGTSVSGNSMMIVQAGNETCTGLRVSRVDADGATVPVACHDLTEPLGAEAVAIAHTADAVMLWVGDTLTTMKRDEE